MNALHFPVTKLNIPVTSAPQGGMIMVLLERVITMDIYSLSTERSPRHRACRRQM